MTQLATEPGPTTTDDAEDLRSPQGFRTAALRHRRQLFAVARRMTGDAHAAEDLVQEALVRAYAQRARFAGRSSAFSWLCGILLNLCRSELRRRRVRRLLSLDRVLEGAEAPPSDPGAAAPGAGLEERERSRALRAAIARLPHKQRAALVLVSLEGVPVREAAQALDTSEAAVWQALSRGRAALRRELRDRF